MRVLVLPKIGLSNVMADSDMTEHIRLIESANRYYQDMWFYFVVPEHALAAVQAANIPKTTLIPVQDVGGFILQEFTFPPDIIRKFNWMNFEMPADGIHTSRCPSGVLLAAALNDTNRQHIITMPVVVREPCSVAPFDEGPVGDELYAVGMALGSPILFGPNAMKNMTQLVTNFVAPQLVKRFQETAYVSTAGGKLEDFDFLLKKNRKWEKFTLFCGMRFNQTKRMDVVYKIYDKFYSSGRPIDIVMTTPTHDLSVYSKAYTHELLQGCIRYLITNCNRERHLDEASKCHAFLVASEGENAPNFLVEQFYLDMIGVVPKREYVFDILPRWYPYVYGDAEEAYAMLVDIYDHPEKVADIIARVKEHLRTNNHVDLVFKGQVDHIRKVIDDAMLKNMRPVTNPAVYRAVRDLLMEFDEAFEFEAFMKICNKKVMIKPAIVKTSLNPRGKETTRHDIRLMLERLGCRDQGDTETLRLKKVVDEWQ